MQKYHFFWGEEDPFSNFYQSKYYHSQEGHLFSCSEQDFMWNKAKYFGDEDIAEKILQLSYPIHIKAAGKLVKGFDETKWAQVRFGIMYDVCFRKFAANKELLQYMRGTGTDFLVEASPFDRIWGIGYARGDAKKVPISDWGLNLLGQVLMNVRSNLGGQLSR